MSVGPTPAVAGAVAQGATAAGGMIGQGMQNMQNMMMHQANQKDALAMWHMQNAYNHPASQMKRLEEAGLNPHLVYGQSAQGAAGNAGAPEFVKRPEPSFNTNPLMVLNTIADTMMKDVQQDNMIKLGQLHEADIALKMAQRGLALANEAESTSRTNRNVFDLELAKELKETSIEMAKAELQNMWVRVALGREQTITEGVRRMLLGEQANTERSRQTLFGEQANTEEFRRKLLQQQARLTRLDANLRQIGIGPGIDPRSSLMQQGRIAAYQIGRSVFRKDGIKEVIQKLVAGNPNRMGSMPWVPLPYIY